MLWRQMSFNPDGYWIQWFHSEWFGGWLPKHVAKFEHDFGFQTLCQSVVDDDDDDDDYGDGDGDGDGDGNADGDGDGDDDDHDHDHDHELYFTKSYIRPSDLCLEKA